MCEDKKHSDSDGKHRDSEGKLLPCCEPKLKKPSQRYPLHASFALNKFGITTEEYDRLFSQRDKNGDPPYFRV